jgi:hypothetical protein
MRRWSATLGCDAGVRRSGATLECGGCGCGCGVRYWGAALGCDTGVRHRGATLDCDAGGTATGVRCCGAISQLRYSSGDRRQRRHPEQSAAPRSGVERVLDFIRKFYKFIIS